MKNASPVGLGAVLTQLEGVEWMVIAYASRGLTDVERRYSHTERERGPGTSVGLRTLLSVQKRVHFWKVI